MDKFDIVVAYDANHGIGKNGELPWRLKADLEHFRLLTTYGICNWPVSEETIEASKKETVQNTVIMGRVTWESIPDKFRPLPGRRNIVLSRAKKFKGSNHATEVHDRFEAALESSFIYHRENGGRVFVIGGETLYIRAVLNSHAKYIYSTRINKDYKCDRFFPKHHLVTIIQDGSTTIKEKGTSFSFYREEIR